MLEIVAGQDGDRTFDRQPALRQRLADAHHPVQHLRVRNAHPLAIRAAPRDEGAIGGLVGPVLQPIGQAPRIRLERLGRAHDHHAAWLALNVGRYRATNARVAKPDAAAH